MYNPHTHFCDNPQIIRTQYAAIVFNKALTIKITWCGRKQNQRKNNYRCKEDGRRLPKLNVQEIHEFIWLKQPDGKTAPKQPYKALKKETAASTSHPSSVGNSNKNTWNWCMAHNHLCTHTSCNVVVIGNSIINNLIIAVAVLLSACEKPTRSQSIHTYTYSYVCMSRDTYL